MENFREITDIVLKDIYVSDELKRKTIEKCTDKTSFKINPAICSTVSAAVLIIAFGLCNYFFHNPNIAVNNQTRNEYRTSVNNDNSKPPIIVAENKPNAEDKSNIKTLDKGTGTENNDNAVQSSNNSTGSSDNTVQNDIDDSQHMSTASNQEQALTATSKPLDLPDAEKYFGSSVLIPKYMPEGFCLTNISIPSAKLKCIKLSYNSRTAYFEILQNKNLSNLNGDKTISIGNNKVYVNYTKDEDSNIKTTTLTWITNSIQYSLSGNLPEGFLINIAKYLN